MQVLSAYRRGLTLVELLVVVVIVGTLVVPLLLTYRSYRTSQALNSSVEALANRVRAAHIFAREARNQREWGIKSLDERAYVLYSSGASGETVEQRYLLEHRISFARDFNILFSIGTGETDRDYTLEVVSDNGNTARVSVSRLGVVEAVRL